jgi:serine/threonine-protein kinase RsbW
VPASKSAVETRSKRALELRIPSELGWERTAMDLAGSVARLMGFPAERVEDIRTAVLEATLNAIEHGNALEAAETVLIVVSPTDERLEITVQDRSSRPLVVPESAFPTPNLQDKLDGRSPARGWGMFLIRSLVDEVEFSWTGEGNLVRMVIEQNGRRRSGPARPR